MALSTGKLPPTISFTLATSSVPNRHVTVTSLNSTRLQTIEARARPKCGSSKGNLERPPRNIAMIASNALHARRRWSRGSSRIGGGRNAPSVRTAQPPSNGSACASSRPQSTATTMHRKSLHSAVSVTTSSGPQSLEDGRSGRTTGYRHRSRDTSMHIRSSRSASDHYSTQLCAVLGGARIERKKSRLAPA